MDLPLIVTALSVVIIVFAFLLGMLRGRNRSILRLCLVIVSAVVALLLRKTVVDTIMHLNVGEDTLANTILATISTGEVVLPDKLIHLLFALIEIIIGLLSFYLVFWVLLFITWVLIFPILKIFIKKGAKKGVLFGGAIGIIQGIIVAIISIAPISGLVYEVNKISHIKLQGNDLFELPAEAGIQDYLDSTTYKIYDKTGFWLFEIMSSTTYEGIENLSLDEIVDTTASLMNVAELVGSISGNIENMNPDLSTPQGQVDTMKTIGDTLIEVGNNLDNLSDNSKELVNTLVDTVKELITPEGETLPPEVENVLNDFDVDSLDLVGAGTAINGIATYIEKTNDDFENTDPVTQDDVNNIVNGLASNSFIIDMIAGENGDGKIVNVEPETATMFENAINNTTLSEEDKLLFKSILGLN